MSKLREENTERLDTLCRNSHKWLVGAAYKITKNLELANELVCELYLYLGERVNPSIWYDDGDKRTFNLLYLRAFLVTRHLNRIKAGKRNVELQSSLHNIGDEDYDIEFDNRVQGAYNDMLDELKELSKTKLWAPARLFEIYQFSEGMTLDKLAKEIGISKSTAFLNTKKVKVHLRNKIKNPFK